MHSIRSTLKPIPQRNALRNLLEFFVVKELNGNKKVQLSHAESPVPLGWSNIMGETAASSYGQVHKYNGCIHVRIRTRIRRQLRVTQQTFVTERTADIANALADCVWRFRHISGCQTTGYPHAMTLHFYTSPWLFSFLPFSSRTRMCIV